MVVGSPKVTDFEEVEDLGVDTIFSTYEVLKTSSFDVPPRGWLLSIFIHVVDKSKASSVVDSVLWITRSDQVGGTSPDRRKGTVVNLSLWHETEVIHAEF